jgi:hypothetical protein
MGNVIDDEVLADAIGYVALNVLDRLAGDAEARRAFLEGFLRSLRHTGWTAEVINQAQSEANVRRSGKNHPCA